MTAKLKDLIPGVVLLITAIAIGLRALGIEPRFPTGADSGYFPERAAALLGVLALVLIARALAFPVPPPSDDDARLDDMVADDRRGGFGRVVAAMLVICVYAGVIPVLGFAPSTVVFIGAGLVVLSPPAERRWLPFLLTALIATALISATFIYGFGVVLPAGPF